MLGKLRAAITQKVLRNGQDFTTLDLLKFIGIITITADHIGYFIFPNNLWWRVVGHSVSPALWFFLVGYSRQHRIDRAWLWYAAVMTLQFLLIGGVPLHPLNIFVSFIVCRYWLNFCEAKRYFASRTACIVLGCIGLAFVLPTDDWVMQYGTVGLLYGMLGRAVRMHGKKHSLWLGGAAAVSAYWSFYHGWSLSPAQAAVLLLLTCAITYGLARLDNRVLVKNWPESGVLSVATILSRTTMHYFFAHVLVLHLVWRILQPN